MDDQDEKRIKMGAGKAAERIMEVINLHMQKNEENPLTKEQEEIAIKEILKTVLEEITKLLVIRGLEQMFKELILKEKKDGHL